MSMGLYHSTTLVEAAKSLAPWNVKGHGKVPYHKAQLKSMVHGVYLHIARYSAMHAVLTPCEQSVATYLYMVYTLHSR